MSEKFKKTVEDFKCENCGEDVDGNGYTNHCPYCLWSKHVDNFPGDRESDCLGMMEPVDAEETGGEWRIIQRCQKCGKIHKNKLSVRDNFDHVVEINRNKSN